MIVDGAKIRELRIRGGLTQQRLADAAKVSRGLITNVEAGRTELSLRVLRAIAYALDVPVDELFAKSDDDINELLVTRAAESARDAVSEIVRTTFAEIAAQNDSEKELLNLFRQLNEKDARAVLQILRAMVRDADRPR